MNHPLFPPKGFVWALLLAAACGGPQMSRRPEVGSDQALYEDRCGRCHDAFPRHAYAKTVWPGIVERMRFEARLTPAEATRINAWLSQGEE